MLANLFSISFLALFGVSVVSGAPAAEPRKESRLAKRFAVLSGQWDSESEASGHYTLYNNLWGESGYTGSQTTQATSVSGTTVAWKTTYTWSGGPYQVKSYANLGLNANVGTKTISQVSSIPAVWKWTYSSASSDLDADVSYDIWLSNTSGPSSANGASTYEIMIWLSTRGGAGPAGSQIGSVSVAGYKWKLFKGTVSNWTVFSFVTDQGEITNFSADLKAFLTYVVSNQGVSNSQYVSGLGAGTEPFIGSATLTTTAMSHSIN